MPGRDHEQDRPAPHVAPTAKKAAATASAHSAVTALAAAAGNQAVARLLLREPDPTAAPVSDSPFQFTKPAAPNLNLDPDFVRKRQEEISGRVRQWLQTQREVLLAEIAKGMPMIELVDWVRRVVPDASPGLAPEQVETMIRQSFDGVQILSHRITADGSLANSELAALVRTVMGIKTELSLERPHGWVKVSASGYEVGLKKGDVEVSGEVGWDKSFGTKGKVGNVHFGASIKPPEKPGDPIGWEAELAFPEEGATVPILEKFPGVMGAANSAIGSLAGDAVRKGLPSPGDIAKGFAPVKDAVAGLSAIAKVKGPTFGVKVEGDGPGIKLMATLTVPF